MFKQSVFLYRVLLFGFSAMFSAVFLVVFPAMGYEWKPQCSYDPYMDRCYTTPWIIWDEQEFPLKLCVQWEDFTPQEQKWIKEASALWNTEYEQYTKQKSTSRQKVGGLPHRLFEFSCESRQWTPIDPAYIIPVYKSDDVDASKLMHTEHRSRFFFGSVTVAVSLRKDFSTAYNPTTKKSLFTDVLAHELGHVLGIPHLRNDTLMYPLIDKCKKQTHICKPSPLTFDMFLKHYETYFYTP